MKLSSLLELFLILSSFCLSPIQSLDEIIGEDILESIPHDLKRTSYHFKNIRFDTDTGVTAAVYDVGFVTNGRNDEERASNFLSRNRSLLNMGAESKSESFAVISKRNLGVWRTIRYGQMYENLPVYDAEIVVTLNTNNVVRMVTSTYKKGINLDQDEMQPKYSSDKIQQKALNKYVQGNPTSLKHYSSKLVIYQSEKNSSTLAWKVNLTPNDGILAKEIIFDGNSGKILLEKDSVHDKKGRKKKFSVDGIEYSQDSTKIIQESNEKDSLRKNKSKKLRQGQYVSDPIIQRSNLSGRKLGILEKIKDFIDWVIRILFGNGESSEPPSSDLPAFTSITPSSAPSMAPTQITTTTDKAFGFVFDPDPLSSGGASYCDPGFCDNNDNDSESLNDRLVEVPLLDLTLRDGTYLLKGPYAQIVDEESPFRGIFSQKSPDFRYTREQNAFEAVNCYYHVDQMMRYINEDLGINVMPTQYQGGAKCDPHASNGDDNSYYSSSTGTIYFGEGGVDDAEDADVIIHELGHALHDWLTNGGLSNVEGLSEGFGDYLASSYSRSKGLWTSNESQYYWVFKWDGHNEFWSGRTTNYDAIYPDGLSNIHESGQIWSTCTMKIWDLLGRTKSDTAHLYGISALGSFSNQDDAANALYLATVDLGYTDEEIDSVKEILVNCGYHINDDICGDGVLGEYEECDGDNIGGAKCSSATGCTNGTPTCTSKCTVDYSSCEADESQLKFQLDILFDRYSEETTWSIENANEQIIFSAGEGPEYDNLSSQSITENRCLERGGCYKFELKDSFSDGFCCDYGEGNYEIHIDSNALNGANPSFSESITHFFGECG